MVIDAVAARVIVESPDPDLPARLVMRVIGEFDAEARPLIGPQILAVAASAEELIIDLSKLTFCDSTGISMFLAVREAMMTNDATLRFQSVVGPVRRVFALSGVDTVFEFVD